MRVTLRPRPVPSPVGLVVKNGSKTLLMTSGGMPGPLSEISTMTTRSPARNGLAVREPKLRRSSSPSSLDQVATETRPPFLTAWTALMKRLTMTCSMRVLSARMGGRVRSRLFLSRTLLRVNWWRVSRAAPSMIWLSWTVCQSSCRWLEKSTMPTMIFSARVMASRISRRMTGTFSSSVGTLPSRYSTPMRSRASGFLTSWATPAARRPMDSSFSAWMSWSWVFLSSSLALTMRSLSTLRRVSARLRRVMSVDMPATATISPSRLRRGNFRLMKVRSSLPKRTSSSVWVSRPAAMMAWSWRRKTRATLGSKSWRSVRPSTLLRTRRWSCSKRRLTMM